VTTVGAILGLALGGCGERHRAAPAPPAFGTTAGGRPAVPALARTPKRSGEVLVTGAGSPSAHGPYSFKGRYRVRFEQVDPEDPGQTFTGQTSFVANAAPAADQEQGAGVVRLVRKAARTGSATVRLDGRLWVNVSFGDFPYALRLTPVGG
jgi:hypothetical protein